MLVTAFEGVTVNVAADAVVGLVDAVAVFVFVFEQVFEDQVAEGFVFVGGGDFGGFDLAGDVALFVGKEDELVTVAGDQAFFLQTLQGCFDAAAQAELVFIDLLDAKGDEVV